MGLKNLTRTHPRQSKLTLFFFYFCGAEQSERKRGEREEGKKEEGREGFEGFIALGEIGATQEETRDRSGRHG